MRFSALFFATVASAHIGAWVPSMLDYNGDGYTSATPMSGLPFSKWWFHGNVDKEDTSATPFSLPVGGTVTVPLGCKKKFAEDSGENPCPDDTPSMHAGSPVDPELLTGCGLAIAYKSEFQDVKPEDFVVFSVQHDCVRVSKTEFEVPAEMPACDGGKCICAWFWQGQSSDNEMYMTGFSCNVEGGKTGATLSAPQPAKHCPDGGCVTGPKQPLYWANDNSNIDFSGDYEEKPTYNMRWGFEDGAQDIGISGGSSEPAPTVPDEDEASPVEDEEDEEDASPVEDEDDAEITAAPEPTEDAQVPVPTTMVTRTRKSKPQPTLDASCSWEGHCAGATCSSWSDCSDDLVCNSGTCGQVVNGQDYN